MIFTLITIVLIVGTAFLLRNATTKKTTLSYFLVLIAGIITFLFEPIGLLLLTDGSVDGGAIQIVSTLLGVYSVGWSIIKMFKMKQGSSFSVIKNLFSREDLNLQNRWWHRAFLVIVLLAFVAFIFQIISWSFSYDKKFTKVTDVNNYINADVVRLSDLVKKNNREDYVISEANYIGGSGQDSTVFGVYKDTTYCSSDIDKLLIDRENGVKNFYLKDDKGQRFSVNKDTLVRMMKNEGIKCVTIDFFTGENYENVYFLEPLPKIQDLGFYKFSFLKTLLNSFVSISGGIAVLLIVLVFYYKILLYVIFGSKKKGQ